MKIGLALVAAITVFGFASTAGAQTVKYDNGPSNGQGGAGVHGVWQADDFTFSTATTFDGIRFWDVEFDGFLYQGGGFKWAVYADNAGMPGTALYSGAANGPHVAQGLGCCGPQFQNDLSIGPVTLGSGTYWLALSEIASDPVFWETANANGTYGSKFSPDGSTWSQVTGLEFTFQLTSAAVVTPEPTSVLLLGTGLLAVVAIGRRRMKQSA